MGALVDNPMHHLFQEILNKEQLPLILHFTRIEKKGQSYQITEIFRLKVDR